MVPSRKTIFFLGSSKADLAAMPDPVRKDFGGAIDGAQLGRVIPDAKALKGNLKGAVQLSEDYRGDTFRAVFTVEFEDTVYVLHCFQKKSKEGSETPKPDRDLIEARLKAARTHYEKRKRSKP